MIKERTIGCAAFGILKRLWQTCDLYWKQGATLDNFMPCYQKIFVPINFCH